MEIDPESADFEARERKRRAFLVACGVLLVLLCLAFPLVLFLGPGSPPAAPVTVEPPSTAPVQTVATAPPLPVQYNDLNVERDPAEIVIDLTETLTTGALDDLKVRKLSRSLAASGKSAATALVRLAVEWNHPALFDALSLVGTSAGSGLPHIEALLDYLDTVCADERLGDEKSNPIQESPEWVAKHVECSAQHKIRPPAQEAWLAIKQSQGTFIRKDWSGNSSELSRALLNAVERERMATVKQLLSLGAYVDTVGPVSVDGKEQTLTPLMAATGNSSTAIFDLLLQVGADIDFRIWYPLNQAIRLRRSDRIDTLLLRGVSLNRQDGNGDYPLTLAASQSNVALTRILIEKGANPYLRDKSGRSAREIALQQSQPELFAAITEAIDRDDSSLQSKFQR